MAPRSPALPKTVETRAQSAKLSGTEIPSTVWSKGARFSEGSPADVEHSLFPFRAKPIHSRDLWTGEKWKRPEETWGHDEQKPYAVQQGEAQTSAAGDGITLCVGINREATGSAAAENYVLWWTPAWVLDTSVVSPQRKQTMCLAALEERGQEIKGSYESPAVQQWSDHAWITASSFGHPSSKRMWKNNRRPSGGQKDGLRPTAAEGATLVKLVKGESGMI